MKKVLTIAGSDSSGGAGIQADLKTMAAHGVYGMSVITALTAQNTTGVFGILNADPKFVGCQLDAVFTDIFPDAVKIGMVSNAGIIETISGRLAKYRPKNVVLDPVMVATSGSKLLDDAAAEALMTKLFPLADVITPNIPEAEVLSGMRITNAGDMLESAKKISDMFKGYILIKGGHRPDTADDLLYSGRAGEQWETWLEGKRIDNPNTHGTGCTLSSAIACNLADDYDIIESVKEAKGYITRALESGLDLGTGSGPLNHLV